MRRTLRVAQYNLRSPFNGGRKHTKESSGGSTGFSSKFFRRWLLPRSTHSQVIIVLLSLPRGAHQISVQVFVVALETVRKRAVYGIGVIFACYRIMLVTRAVVWIVVSRR